MNSVNNGFEKRRQILLSSFFPFNFILSLASANSTNLATTNNVDDNTKNTHLALVLPQTLSTLSQLPEPITHYLMSEKLDGVRAYWDGRKLYFRSGRVINAPAWFTAKFPMHAMDGELWMGRAQFDRLSGVVRRQEVNEDEWRQISYCLFEYPMAAGEFHHRLKILQQELDQLQIPWLRMIPQESLKSAAQVQEKLKQLTAQKAEGLVLHLASAQFVAGRSDYVYKFKPQHDAEAKVIAIQEGRGKYQGMMGALMLETPEGVRFKLGTGFDDEQRKNPPPVGTWVTYRYRDITSKGLPKFASFVRVYQTE